MKFGSLVNESQIEFSFDSEMLMVVCGGINGVPEGGYGPNELGFLEYNLIQ